MERETNAVPPQIANVNNNAGLARSNRPRRALPRALQFILQDAKTNHEQKAL